MPGHLDFSSSGFMPDILALHVIADAAITLACFSVLLMLLYLVRRRTDLRFNWIVVCFTVFIVGCGTTHFMEILTIWQPLYWLSGAVKAVTALASILTAILLVRLLPTALHWPGPAALQRISASLEREIAERKRAQAQVRQSSELLEVRVAERTEELEAAYRSLRETQQASMQQERLRALGRMASAIVHDINNALTPATLYTASLLTHDRSLSHDARDDLRIIQQAIEDVARTVGRIREFYRERDANTVRVPIQIEHLLEQVLDLTRDRWADRSRAHGIDIDVLTDYAAELPPILGVQGEIKDALVNLVFNAVDAMPEGGSLTLRSYCTPNHVTIEVCDSGVGMSEEVRTRCLDPFFTTKGVPGAGLGLALVYGMTERHGAVLEIDSEPGCGTVVRLVFPAAGASERAAAPVNESRRPGSGLRILFIDDDQLLRRSMRSILEREGHEVAIASSGRVGIDLFTATLKRGEHFDTVITDLGMPQVDGRAVASAVKALSPNTPVILLTGWGEHLREGDGLPRDVDQLLSKPASLAQLRAVLAAWVPASALRA